MSTPESGRKRLGGRRRLCLWGEPQGGRGQLISGSRCPRKVAAVALAGGTPGHPASAPEEGKVQSKRTQGAQGLSHLEKPLPPHSQGFWAPIESRQERSKGGRGSRSQQGTAPSSPKGEPFGTTAGGAPQRQEEKAEAPPQLPAWSSKALRREPWGLVPTRPRLLSWQDHSFVGAESPATPYAWPEPNRNHPCPPGIRATVCAPAPAPVTRRYTEARNPSRCEKQPPTLIAGGSTFQCYRVALRYALAGRQAGETLIHPGELSAPSTTHKGSQCAMCL